MPRAWKRRDPSHTRPPLLARMWRAVADWSAGRDFNSHQ
jgi:hypothetical protein